MRAQTVRPPKKGAKLADFQRVVKQVCLNFFLFLGRRRHFLTPAQTVGVFNYLKVPDIWQKMYEPSRGLEEALAEFDKQYPGSSQLNFKLRDAYCFWIDAFSSSIEAEYRFWADQYMPGQILSRVRASDRARAQAWINSQMKNNGGAS